MTPSLSLPTYIFNHLCVSLLLLLPLHFSIYGYINRCEGLAMWAAEWRRAASLCELSFTKKLPSSAALQTASASSVCTIYEPTSITRHINVQHPLLLKYYGPSGTITWTFYSNGCCCVLQYDSIVEFQHFTVFLIVWHWIDLFLLVINLMIMVQSIKHVQLPEPKLTSLKFISYFVWTVGKPNVFNSQLFLYTGDCKSNSSLILS